MGVYALSDGVFRANLFPIQVRACNATSVRWTQPPFS